MCHNRQPEKYKMDVEICQLTIEPVLRLFDVVLCTTVVLIKLWQQNIISKTVGLEVGGAEK